MWSLFCNLFIYAGCLYPFWQRVELKKCLASLFCECLYTIKGYFPVWKALKWFALYEFRLNSSMYRLQFPTILRVCPHQSALIRLYIKLNSSMFRLLFTVSHYSVGEPSLIFIFYTIRITFLDLTYSVSFTLASKASPVCLYI